MEDRHGGRILCGRFFGNLRSCHDFTLSDVDNFRPGQLETLYDFFTTKTEYWKMAPHLELVASHNVLLALPGTEYVAYFPRGGTNAINLAAGTYSVEWLRAETGRVLSAARHHGGGRPARFRPAGQRRHRLGAPSQVRDSSTDSPALTLIGIVSVDRIMRAPTGRTSGSVSVPLSRSLLAAGKASGRFACTLCPARAADQ